MKKERATLTKNSVIYSRGVVVKSGTVFVKNLVYI